MELYDFEFRQQVLKLLMQDKSISQKIIPFLKKDYFPEPQLRLIFEAIRNIREKYEDVSAIPSGMMKTEIQEICSIRGEDYSFYSEVFSNIQDIDINEDFILEKIKNWIKREEIRKSLSRAIDLLEKDKLDEIKYALDKSFELDMIEDEGISIKDNEKFLDMFREKYDVRKLTSTGYKGYDDILLGGFAKGELHVVVAPPKRFKSTFAVNVGFNVLKQRKSVIHISLELSEIDVLAKYYQIMLQATPKQLLSMNKEDFINKTTQLTALLQGNLFIKYFTPNTVTVEAIRSYIVNLQLDGKLNEIGLIIVDYDDLLLAKSGQKEMYEKAGDIYADLISIADKFQAPILTLAQPNREAWTLDLQGEYIKAHHLAHSSKKAHYCYSISSLNLQNSSYSDKKDIILYADMVRRGKSQKTAKLVAFPELAYIQEKQ